MKFLIQIPQLIYGGAEKVLVDFANYLVEKGHDVEILETYERGLLKKEFNSKVAFSAICSNEYTNKYYVPLKKIIDEKSHIEKIKKIIKKIFITIAGYERLAKYFCKKKYKDKSFDVAINYLETESPKFCVRYIRANKYLQWIHTDISKLEDTRFIDKNKKWYKKMDKIICVSEYSKESFLNKYKDLRDRTTVIYNFYNVDKIKKMSEEFSNIFDKNDFNILSVGRLVKEKGYERAIDIFYKLKKEGHKLKYYIIGDGILRVSLENKIKELNMKDEIKLLGIKDNPYPYIKECDLLFLPSLYEGFPTVTIEAKILEKPILVTEVSGIKEQIVDKETGIIVGNNKNDIYLKLKQILLDKNLLKVLSNNELTKNIFENSKKYKELLVFIENK